MARIALDSNLLVYAELEPESEKGKRSTDIILRAARNGVISVQVLGKYLRAIQRRVPAALADAAKQAEIYRATFLTPATTHEVMEAAGRLALAHGIQLWDAVICVASDRSGAKALLSEDLQDGRLILGLRIVNPFETANDAIVEGLLS